MTIDDQTTVGPIAGLDVILQRVGREAILHDDAFGEGPHHQWICSAAVGAVRRPTPRTSC